MPGPWIPTAAALTLTLAAASADAQTLRAQDLMTPPPNAAAIVGTTPAWDAPSASIEHRAFATPPVRRGAQQASPDHGRAVQAFERGVQFADQLQWAEAADAFQEAYRLEPLPSTLRNLGLAHRALGRYTQAVDELERFLSEANPQPDIRAQIQDVITQMRSELAVITVTPSVATASLTLDNRPIHAGDEVQLDPGNHVVAATASGYVRTAQTFTIQRAEHRHIDLRLDSAGGGILSQWWLWTIVGAVVAGGAVAAGVVLLSHEEAPNCGTLNVCVSPR